MGKSGRSIIPDLISLLKSSNPDVRRNAVYVLGAVGKSAKSAVPYLIPLLQDSDKYVRLNTAEALKKLDYQP
jgi:HEAT repeat protein